VRDLSAYKLYLSQSVQQSLRRDPRFHFTHAYLGTTLLTYGDSLLQVAQSLASKMYLGGIAVSVGHLPPKPDNRPPSTKQSKTDKQKPRIESKEYQSSRFFQAGTSNTVDSYSLIKCDCPIVITLSIDKDFLLLGKDTTALRVSMRWGENESLKDVEYIWTQDKSIGQGVLIQDAVSTDTGCIAVLDFLTPQIIEPTKTPNAYRQSRVQFIARTSLPDGTTPAVRKEMISKVRSQTHGCIHIPIQEIEHLSKGLREPHPRLTRPGLGGKPFNPKPKPWTTRSLHEQGIFYHSDSQVIGDEPLKTCTFSPTVDISQSLNFVVHLRTSEQFKFLASEVWHKENVGNDDYAVVDTPAKNSVIGRGPNSNLKVPKMDRSTVETSNATGERTLPQDHAFSA
jgi:hypothetical protein